MVLTERGLVNREPPAELADPPIIALKDGFWRGAREITGQNAATK